MSSKKVSVPYKGRIVEGEEISFKEIEERWNEYELSDGTKLKSKSVLASVFRLNEYNESNEPIYVVNSTIILNVNVPEGLKKKGS